jgi:glycosylphosphatidylinositol transamidase
MAWFFGLCAFYGPHYFVQSAVSMHLKPQQGMAIGLLAIHLAILGYPAIKNWHLSRRRYHAMDWPSPDVRVLKCLALLWLGVTLGATSILNISLAFFVSAIWIPVVLLVSPSNSRVSTLLQRLALLIISPLGLACLAAITHQAFLTAPPPANSDQPGLPLVHWLADAWELVGNGLHALVLQAELLSNWTYGLLALAMLPNWVLFTLIVGADPAPLGV